MVSIEAIIIVPFIRSAHRMATKKTTVDATSEKVL
jgi:hypothetical protein